MIDPAFGAMLVSNTAQLGMYWISIEGDVTEINLVDNLGVVQEGGTFPTDLFYDVIKEFFCDHF